eukprot:9574642-Alexandrium_andersonii.AAC.1
MSASLVGSEMCIRDRIRTLWQGSAESELVPRVGETRQPRRERSATSVCAVSYTHLTLPTICSV